MIHELTDNNIKMYAISHYDNPNCTGIEEFEEDFCKIKYIKRLLRRYYNKNILKERLILNHLITFYNVFGTKAATKMLFFSLNPKLYPVLKPFLIYLKYIDDESNEYENISLDNDVINRLRNFDKCQAQ